MYWICTLILISLETLFLVYGYETLPIVCVGLCWLGTVLGFGIKTIRFSDYLRLNYPLEYKNMLNTKKILSQLKYKPRLNDPILVSHQTALTHYLRFMLFGILAPFIDFLLFM